MEEMPLVILLFYSVPESIILISLSSALYGYDVKNNIRRIVLLSVCLALITYFIRALPVKFGINALIELPLFIFLTSYFLKVPLKRTLIFILTGFACIAVAESITNLIVINIMGINLNSIYVTLWQRLLYGWGILALLLIPSFLAVKKSFTFTTAVQFFSSSFGNIKFILLVPVLLVGAFLAGFLELVSIYGENSVWPTLLDKVFLRKIVAFSLLTIPVISLLLLKRFFDLSQQEAIIAAQEAFLGNLNNLLLTIRGQRHDFINHVQVIYSLIHSNKTDEAIKYMDNLLDDIQEVNEVIKVKDPAFSALLNTKLAVAERHNILFESDIESSFDKLNIKSLDLVKILGNLLDNAIEAVMDQPPEHRLVRFNIKKYCNLHVIEVFNPRPIIPDELINKIFDGGFSTKSNTGHTGLGLQIVKDILKKYKGEIGVKSSEKTGTVFTVVIPS